MNGLAEGLWFWNVQSSWAFPLWLTSDLSHVSVFLSLLHVGVWHMYTLSIGEVHVCDSGWRGVTSVCVFGLNNISFCESSVIRC